jgi:hypothetical protein
MVISIDAVRYSAEMDATTCWHATVAETMPEEELEQEAEILAPARGALYGLLLSTAMWVGVVAAARAVLTLMR